MTEIGPAHPFSYRKEIVERLFSSISSRDSCVVVGSGSMGKSRLLQFILHTDVQRHYLGDDELPLFVLADANRLAKLTEWGLWELLLTALLEVCGKRPGIASLRTELNAMRRDAIMSDNVVLARRNVELAIHMLCQEHATTLCIVFDEFDEAYRTLPALALANLRALRDMHKYRLCYMLIVRDHPSRLRPIVECEGFYELFSRSVSGLGPYQPIDAERVITQLEARKHRVLTANTRERLLRLSGGHPGLIVALFDVLCDDSLACVDDELTCMLMQPMIEDECSKLWSSLAEDERIALSRLAHGFSTTEELQRLLLLKGLIQQGTTGMLLFSPLFGRFVQLHSTSANKRLWVDEGAGVVWLDEQPIKGLTAREFELVAFLYKHLGQIRTREQILNRLYSDEVYDAQDNRVDTLIKRVREKIEPMRDRPRYILTIRGRGYKMIERPEEAAK